MTQKRKQGQEILSAGNDGWQEILSAGNGGGQEILYADSGYGQLQEYLKKHTEKILLVCGSSIGGLKIGGFLESLAESTGIKCVRFSDFSPNPSYSSAEKGAELFRRTGCDAVLAVGGGSAIDVAKCIRLCSGHPPVPFAAVPTTAGSGSEATRFAVIYRDGEKQSITDDRCLPDAVLFDPSALRSLPDYQRKAAMLDAFCHALESFWSVRSTEESRAYAGQALRMIMENFRGYLEKGEESSRNMLAAAHLAGKAINIAQTTAGHAMCYKLTGLYGTAHGHAAALCVSRLWPYMLEHPELCTDSRGSSYLMGIFDKMAETMGCGSARDAARRFACILDSLQLGVPKACGTDTALLAESVNPVRLKNSPVHLDRDALEGLYRQILDTGHLY